MARFTTLRRRAEQIARDDLGWVDAAAIDARPAGRDGRCCAVLISVPDPDEPPFAIVFDEWDELATDAGDPADFGWGSE